MINIIIYTLSLLFVWSNIYYLLNYERLDKRFTERDRNSKVDLVYYITKVLFWIWLVVGLFTPMKYTFIIMIVIGLLRIPIYHISKKLSSIWFRLTPPFYIILMIQIFIEIFRH
jgi:hypothetical protein